MLIIKALQSIPIFYFYLLVTLLGLAIGSFLNVVIYRLPIMLHNALASECTEFITNIPASFKKNFNLFIPRSQCPACHHTITILSNIPIISFILQKGKCKYCGVKISWRYPAVELMSMLASLTVVTHFGISLQTLVVLLLTWALIAIIFIDAEHQLIPDSLSVGLVWLGLLANVYNIFTTPTDAIIGAISAYVSLWLVAYTFKLIRNIEGMGHGDFKLFASFGAFFGWQALPFIILLASILALGVGFILIANRKHHFNKPMPFGPYLAIAGWTYVLWSPTLWHWLMQKMV